MLSLLYPIIGIMFLGMISPGPDFVLIMRNSQKSLVQAIGTALGITLGLSIHLALVIYGLSQFITESIILSNSISVLGAFYLIYIALKILKESSHTHEKIEKKNRGFLTGFKEGFVCNILNPKLILFLLSILSQYLNEISQNDLQLFAYMILLLECMIVWITLSMLFQLSFIKSFFTQYELILNKVFAIALFFFAIKIIFSLF